MGFPNTRKPETPDSSLKKTTLALDCEGGNFLNLRLFIFWFMSFSGYRFFKKMFLVFLKLDLGPLGLSSYYYTDKVHQLE